MRNLIIALYLFLSGVALAQIPTGTWNTYFSYSKGYSVTVAGSKVYAVGSGFLYAYNNNDNSIKTYSKIDGLNDVDIAFVRYNKAKDLLFIAYTNGNIDLLKDNTIKNIQDIKLATLTGSKKPNNVFFTGSMAYIASDAGVIILDLDANEIKETYILSSGGNQNPVNGVAVFNNTIYAATDNGVYKCNTDNPNILDFSQWQYETLFPEYNNRYASINVFSGTLLAVRADSESSPYTGYRLNNNAAVPFIQGGRNFRRLQISNDYLVLSAYTHIYIYNSSWNLLKYTNKYVLPEVEFVGQDNIRSADIALFNENTMFVSDINLGMVKYVIDGNSEILIPDGPASNIYWEMDHSGGILRVVHGALDQSWNNRNMPAELSVLQNGEWSILNKNTVPGIENAVDFVSVATDPLDPEHFFAASYRYGLYEFNGLELTKRYYDDNSSLEDILTDQIYVRIHSLVFDKEFNLWLSNAYVSHPIHRLLREADDFNSYNFSRIDNAGSDAVVSLGEMIVRENNDKWLVVPRSGGGVFVFNENGTTTKTDDQTKMLYLLTDNEGKEFASNITCIAEDKDGVIWVGTDNGIGVYSSPDNVFEENVVLAARIKVPRENDDDNAADWLLDSEWINDIVVDGGNRKWIATLSSGVLLVSPDGLTTIAQFTTKNSPLPSNTVTSIAIDDKTGEVFMGTAVGLVSFGGDATAGNDNFDEIRAFPNPVRENFTGVVTITGLVAETVVKITDISGNLVYETVSDGGSVSWDRRNMFGEYVGTGIYMIFCATKDGSQSALTKLLVINSKQ